MRAAQAIYGRLVERLGGRPPTPEQLLADDQGSKNAVLRADGLGAVPKPDALTAIAEPWRPYRTRACKYLWRSLDNAPI